jgi:nanoRNase/pAp phosphatase (c-di-AMP/oligoRNAs hydrolase)
MCCSTPVLQSEVAGKLAEKGHFGATFFLNDDRTATFSLRSRCEFDVSLVAKKFGGGGHRNAAGFMVSIAQLVPQEKSS